MNLGNNYYKYKKEQLAIEGITPSWDQLGQDTDMNYKLKRTKMI